MLLDECDTGGTVASGTFTAVQYHSGDSYDTAFGTQRKTFYALSGTPLAWFDGVVKCSGAYSTIPAQFNWYKTTYTQCLAVPTDVTIEMTATEIDSDTYDVHVKVCTEAGGTARQAKLYVVQVLDYWPASPTYQRNGHRQTAVASPAPFDLVPGQCSEVTYTFNFDATSMATPEDIKIIAWVQSTNAAAPSQVYQAGEMVWPFPSSQSACPDADVNEDGICDGFDVALVRNSSNWLKDVDEAAEPRCDINGDGLVDGFDISIIRRSDCWLK
jgi:hypothetical protein